MNKIYRIGFLLAALALGRPCAAQPPVPTKTIEVSEAQPYQEVLSSNGMNITLKMFYSQADSTLTARIIADSGQHIFGFIEPVKYIDVWGGWLFIKAKKIPYSVVSKYRATYMTKTAFRKQMTSPNFSYQFQPWITGYGMENVSNDKQYMVNDSLQMKFHIKKSYDDIFVVVGDVIGVSLRKMATRKYPRYQFMPLAPFDTKYRIIIKKDPCFPYSDTLNSLLQSLSVMQKDSLLLGMLHSTFTKNPSKGGAEMFAQMKEKVLSRYSQQPLWHECDRMWDAYKQYNSLLEDFNSMQCEYQSPEVGTDQYYIDMGDSIPPLDIPALQKIIRLIDRIKLRYISNTREVDRRDLMVLGQMNIDDGYALLDKSRVLTKEEKKAKQDFESAVDSFYKYCQEL